jgi:hypothetical protein
VGRLFRCEHAGCARSLGALDGFDDTAEGGFAADLFRLNLQHSRLINGSGEDLRSRDLFGRHGLAGNRRLIDEGMTAHDGAIHRNSAAGPHQDDVAELEFREISVCHLPCRFHFRGVRQQVQQLLDRPTPTPDRHPFQDFSNQHKNRDEERREELPDNGSRDQR